MRFVMFYHSLVSDWNHGNAHFLRGIVTELLDRDHDVQVFEPLDGWSRANLVRDGGAGAIAAFHRAYPRLRSAAYTLETLDLDDALGAADVVVVHEWNEPELVARIGSHRAARMPRRCTTRPRPSGHATNGARWHRDCAARVSTSSTRPRRSWRPRWRITISR